MVVALVQIRPGNTYGLWGKVIWMKILARVIYTFRWIDSNIQRISSVFVCWQRDQMLWISIRRKMCKMPLLYPRYFSPFIFLPYLLSASSFPWINRTQRNITNLLQIKKKRTGTARFNIFAPFPYYAENFVYTLLPARSVDDFDFHCFANSGCLQVMKHLSASKTFSLLYHIRIRSFLQRANNKFPSM